MSRTRLGASLPIHSAPSSRRCSPFMRTSGQPLTHVGVMKCTDVEQRDRRHLRQAVQSACAQSRYRTSDHRTEESLAKSLRGTGYRDSPSRMLGQRHCPSRAAPAQRSRFLHRFLPSVENPSGPGDGCAKPSSRAAALMREGRRVSRRRRPPATLRAACRLTESQAGRSGPLLVLDAVSLPVTIGP